MQDKKLLKEFYLIADALEKNILIFNELESKLKKAQEENNVEEMQNLLEKYKIVSNSIKKLKEQSKKLKEENKG